LQLQKNLLKKIPKETIIEGEKKMTFQDKVKQMDMNTILNFAKVGYEFMQYRKENKEDELLNILKQEVQK